MDMKLQPRSGSESTFKVKVQLGRIVTHLVSVRQQPGFSFLGPHWISSFGFSGSWARSAALRQSAPASPAGHSCPVGGVFAGG